MLSCSCATAGVMQRAQLAAFLRCLAANLPHVLPVPCRDEDDAEEAAESGQEYEGHLVAHIKVPPTYFEAQQQSPAAGTPHALSRSGSGTDTQAAGNTGAGAGGSGSGPTTPRLPAVPAVSPHAIASMLLPGAGAAAAAAAAAAPRQQQSPQQQSPQQQQQQPQQQQQQQSPQQQQQSSQQQVDQQAAQQQSPAAQAQQPLSGADTEVIQQASDTLAAALTAPRSMHSTPPFSRQAEWLAEAGLSCTLAM